MNLTFNDLFLLLPLIILTSSVVLVMISVGVRRNYIVAAGITGCGLLLAAIISVIMLPYTNQQVSPLLIIDQYSCFLLLSSALRPCSSQYLVLIT